jgi:serine/threonine protein kinase
MPREFTGKTDFEREVAALQLLSKTPHPHVVQLYDLHRDQHNYYLAMELIEGEELLEHLLLHGPYSEGIAASFIRQFAEGISFVHSNGLAHADLKPENLLLAYPENNDDFANATLKLVDFGAARTHDLSRKDMHLPAEEFARGCSFLHMVALGNQFELEKLLQDRPQLVNFRDYDYRTGLHLASSEGHVDICRFLVEKGAKLDRVDRWGGTPLDDAHRHRHAQVIKYLREQGSSFGKQHNNTHSQFTPRFIQAAAEGDKEEIQALLEYGNHMDYLDQGDYDGRRALHLAAGEGRIEIVDLLCQAGANVNVEDRWGNRPLDDALNAKNKNAVIQVLLKYGARSAKNLSVNQIQVIEDEHPAPPKPANRKAPQTKAEEEECYTGTIAYQPPELFIQGAIPTPSTDCWAAGVIMYILLTGT